MRNRFLFTVCCLVLIMFDARAQSAEPIADAIKDSIINRFNRNDLPAIYDLADTSFTKDISRDKLVNFLKGNWDNGKITGSNLIADDKGTRTYKLEFEGRDMKMILKVDANKKFTTFGLANLPQPMLDALPRTPTDNPLKTKIDLAVDSLARDYFRYSGAAGVSIGIIYKGKLYRYNYGQVVKGKPGLPTAATIYELASVTKTFTATLLAQAVLDGKAALNDDIRKYLKGNFDNLSYKGTPVTLQDLANHTSRLPTLPPDIGDQKGFVPRTPEMYYDSSMFYHALANVKLDTVPGYKFEYSNWGMALLGHILEQVYHQPYAELLKRYITDPLKMKDTYYLPSSKYKEQIAIPYAENGKPAPYQQESIFYPAGGIHSDINDMLRYLQAQINETNPAIKLSHQPTKNGMGLAWGARKEANYRNIQHNGSSYGFTSNITAFPEMNGGCVILANNKIGMGKLIVGIQKIVRQGDL